MNPERNENSIQNDHDVNSPLQDEGVMSDGDMDLSDNDSDTNKLGVTKRVGTSVSDEALRTLNELRHNNLLCDAVISVTDGSFNVHRAIMSACSSYFR